MQDPQQADHPHQEDVVSPFAYTESSVPGRKTSRGHVWLYVGVGAVLAVVLAVVGLFVFRYLDDPYRTLEPFPLAKYLDNHRSLAGAKFRAQLRVENDLDYKDGVGRLMLFSSTEDSRPFAVMVPEAVADGMVFTKGQTYMSELEVKEGGLIYSNRIEKD